MSVPRNLFKSISFDCGKEFSNWKSIINQQDVVVHFAGSGTPSQLDLNGHSNGVLRKKDGFSKDMDFNKVNQVFVSKGNNIPRESLNYHTPLEIFLRQLDGRGLSHLI